MPLDALRAEAQHLPQRRARPQLLAERRGHDAGEARAQAAAIVGRAAADLGRGPLAGEDGAHLGHLGRQRRGAAGAVLQEAAEAVDTPPQLADAGGQLPALDGGAFLGSEGVGRALADGREGLLG